MSLFDLSHEKPVMLVFLRHFGCVFCREALIEISKNKAIWCEKVHVVLVHMSTPDVAKKYLEKYGLESVTNISDPSCSIYAAFGLVKGNVGQLFGLKVWARTAELALTGKVIPTIYQIGDGFQMPGIFAIHNGNIVEEFIHKSVADVPDYDTILNCCHT